VFVAVGLLLAWVSGRLSPHFVNDSFSYQHYDFDSLESMARQTRLPGYPLWLVVVTKTLGIFFVPAAQVVVHATASWLLLTELQRWGMSIAASIVVGIAVGFGCTATDNISTISSDALAASLGVIAIVCVLRWARIGSSRSTIALTIAATTAAIFVRPAYLFLCPWLVIAATLLGSMSGAYQKPFWTVFKSALFMTVLSSVPVLAWMSFRLVTVNDFGVLPFGHQNLAGVLVQLLSDDELESLENRGTVAREMARKVVEIKNQYETETGFEPGEFGATMTIDNRWDEMTYFVVAPASVEIAGEDVVAGHRAIATMNKSIVRSYPLRYAKWLLKSARRGAWAIAANIVMHPIFLAAIVGMIGLVLYRSVFGGLSSQIEDDQTALRALTIVTFTYLGCKLGFVILTSPAIGRFSDAAAVLLPGWIGAVFLTWWIGATEKTPTKSS
jgi:hypothetical protein